MIELAKKEGFNVRVGGMNSIKPGFEKKLAILDAGHGGVIDGLYQTPGKRSYFTHGQYLGDEYSLSYKEKHNTEKYYEGVGNRLIRHELEIMLFAAGIPYIFVDDSQKDMSLQKRCNFVNKVAKLYGKENCLLFSIHSDAFSDPMANGWSAYTSPGNTASDPVATVGYSEAEKKWPGANFRKSLKDGDPDKEAKFKMLVGTTPRAVLFENWFMTNYNDYTNHLKTTAGRIEIAEVLFQTILKTL